MASGTILMDFEVLNAQGSEQAWGIHRSVNNPNSSFTGKDIAFIPNAYGFLLYNLTDSQTIISFVIPVSIEQGGTGQNGTIVDTTISNIATEGTNIQITSASYCQWGKMAQVELVMKTTSAISSGSIIAKIKSGKTPCTSMTLMESKNRGHISFGEDGNMYAWYTIPNDDTFAVRAVYLRP